jgi:hypothetical protein
MRARIWILEDREGLAVSDAGLQGITELGPPDASHVSIEGVLPSSSRRVRLRKISALPSPIRIRHWA